MNQRSTIVLGMEIFSSKPEGLTFAWRRSTIAPVVQLQNEAIFLKTRCLPIQWDAKQKVYHGASDPRKDGMAAGY